MSLSTVPEKLPVFITALMTPDSPRAYVSLLSFAPAVVQSQETWILLMVTGVPEVLVKGKDAVMLSWSGATFTGTTVSLKDNSFLPEARLPHKSSPDRITSRVVMGVSGCFSSLFLVEKMLAMKKIIAATKMQESATLKAGQR